MPNGSNKVRPWEEIKLDWSHSFITVKLTINKIVVTKAEEINQVKSSVNTEGFFIENFFFSSSQYFDTCQMFSFFIDSVVWKTMTQINTLDEFQFFWFNFFNFRFKGILHFLRYFSTFLCRVMQNNFVMDIVQFFFPFKKTF